MQPVSASKCIVKMYCSSKPDQLSQLRLKIFERERMLLFLLSPSAFLLVCWLLRTWAVVATVESAWLQAFVILALLLLLLRYCCATTFSSTFLTCIMSLVLFLGWGLLKVEWFQIRVLYYSRSSKTRILRTRCANIMAVPGLIGVPNRVVVAFNMPVSIGPT